MKKKGRKPERFLYRDIKSGKLVSVDYYLKHPVTVTKFKYGETPKTQQYV
jgi:hypothetical protein